MGIGCRLPVPDTLRLKSRYLLTLTDIQCRFVQRKSAKMEHDVEPVGQPPSYSEIVKNDSSFNAAACGQENACADSDVKHLQYTWVNDPMMNLQCPPSAAGRALYPPSPAGPGQYGPPYGQPMFTYYHQAGYSSPYYVGGSQYQQQPQQQVMMVDGQQHHQPVLIQHVQSFAGHIVLSCVVAFCCNFLLGCIAFILASKNNTVSLPILWQLYF